MAILQKIVPNLWYDKVAEDAVKFYTSIFKDSKIGRINRFPDVGKEEHGQDAGTIATIQFWLNGQEYLALNGGPLFKFTEAVSFVVYCDTQEEIDYYWEKLSEGGDKNAQQCGWLKDKFGLSWQVSPIELETMLEDETSEKTKRAFAAMLKMKKLDIAKLKEAYKG